MALWNWVNLHHLYLLETGSACLHCRSGNSKAMMGLWPFIITGFSIYFDGNWERERTGSDVSISISPFKNIFPGNEQLL